MSEDQKKHQSERLNLQISDIGNISQRLKLLLLQLRNQKTSLKRAAGQNSYKK